MHLVSGQSTRKSCCISAGQEIRDGIAQPVNLIERPTMCDVTSTCIDCVCHCRK